MIINNTVEVIVSSNHLKYYEDLGYTDVKYLKPLSVNPLHLSKGSHVKVMVECDICHSITEHQYRGIKLTKENEYHCKNCIIRKPKIYSDEEKEVCREKSKLAHLKKIIENKNFLTEVHEKGKLTKILKYDNPNYNNQEKKRETILLKYGTKSHSNMSKKKKTCELKYGNPTYNNQKKKIETCLLKYGVEHTNQVEEIFIKLQKSAFELKRFEDSDIFYRGTYELDFLLFCKNNNIIVENHTPIDYYFNGKNRKYYPDFYHRATNTIIEIKSWYTFGRSIDMNLEKKKSVLEKGYKFIMVMDKKYKRFKKIITK